MLLLLLGSLLFTVIAPGTLAVLIPFGIALAGRPNLMPERWGAQQYAALLPALLGVFTYFRCVWDFAAVGRCTPMLGDLPRGLIVRGLYQHVRNPMYLGILSLLVGEAAFFESSAILAYAAGLFAFFHLVVVFLEEPMLRSEFGESYARYCQSVRRWTPGRRCRKAV